MNRQQEKILIAALCGLVMAAGHVAAGPVQVSGVDHWFDAGRVAPWRVDGGASPVAVNPGLLAVPNAAKR